jgi:predicted PurR-regulated permease PerM
MAAKGNISALGHVLIVSASLVVVVAGMKAASAIIVPFLLAAFIAVICAPPLRWMQDRRVPTGLAVLVIVLFLLVCMIFFGLFIGTSMNDFLAELPVYQARLEQQTSELRNWMADHGVEISSGVFRQQFNPGTIMQMVGNMLTSLTGMLTNTFMILLTVIFILLEASGLPLKLRVAMGDLEASLGSYKEFLESVNRYLIIKTVMSLLTGICVIVWLSILKIDFPVLWGLVAFLLNYVPNIGSIIAAVPVVLLGLVQYGFASALLVAGGYLAVNTVFGSILEPRVMGKGLGLSTLIVFASLVFWGWILGPVGMLLSVPLTMIVKIALQSRKETRWLAILLGSAPPPPHTE